MKSKNAESMMAKYEIPANLIRSFAILLQDNPVIARNVAKDIADLAGLGVSGGGSGKPASSEEAAYAAIRDVFKANDNRAISKKEMQDLAKVGESAVHALLYKSDLREKFVPSKNPAGGKALVYVMTQEALEG